MYIPGVVVGIVGTILIELFILIIIAVLKGDKK